MNNKMHGYLRKKTRSIALILVIATSAMSISNASAQRYDPEESIVWQQLKKTVFEQRAINATHNNTIRLDINGRAEDASVVPVVLRTVTPQQPERYIKKIWLVIDNNPSPIGVVFNLTPESGRADIETRVRVENSTFVRAIAETSDGSLFMDVKTIAAAGGCSAPGGADDSAASMGKMKFRVDDEIELNKPNLAKLMVNHPNFSGLSKEDKRVQFVKHLVVSYAGREIMSADIDFTISKNPTFNFYFLPTEKGELKAEIIDTNDLKFESSLAIKPGS
jgi:sulfur-oxidizing protein SoxY